MVKYYKHWAESDLGEGEAYLEVVDDIVTRQVEVYNGEMFWSTWEDQKDIRFIIADQPASEIDLTSEFEIDSQEFEDIWGQAHR